MTTHTIILNLFAPQDNLEVSVLRYGVGDYRLKLYDTEEKQQIQLRKRYNNRDDAVEKAHQLIHD